MKSLCSIERIAIIRWVTIAYLGALVLPLLFLRYGNTIAVAQSALLIMLPIATAGLALSHAKVPASYVSFSIHDKVLLRFIAKNRPELAQPKRKQVLKQYDSTVAH